MSKVTNRKIQNLSTSLSNLCSSFNFIKGKWPLNAMYILKYPALENKHFGANLIKIGEKILYFIFYFFWSFVITELIAGFLKNYIKVTDEIYLTDTR